MIYMGFRYFENQYQRVNRTNEGVVDRSIFVDRNHY